MTRADHLRGAERNRAMARKRTPMKCIICKKRNVTRTCYDNEGRPGSNGCEYCEPCRVGIEERIRQIRIDNTNKLKLRVGSHPTGRVDHNMPHRHKLGLR